MIEKSNNNQNLKELNIETLKDNQQDLISDLSQSNITDIINPTKDEITSKLPLIRAKLEGLDNLNQTETGETFLSNERFPLPEEYLAMMIESGFDDHAQAYQKVLELSDVVKSNGGRALLVGGSVRDVLMGKISKDFDVEIYGLEPDIIEEIIQEIGKVSSVGKSFGILKISLDNGLDIDVSLPRTDSKVDTGHRGFEVKTDPYMSFDKACKRRDFTFNAIMADTLTGDIYDAFGGVEDIKNRVLRVTDPERFRDDPLRVMRALQFVGRFGFSIEDASLSLIKEMSPELRELPKERIGEEWKKLLLKSEKPSLGISAGMTLGVFQEIHPEFVELVKDSENENRYPQSQITSWINTLIALDESAKIVKKEELDPDKSLTVLLSSLCHNLGGNLGTENTKQETIKENSQSKQEEFTKKFLSTIGIDNVTKEKVIKLVKNNLIPIQLYVDDIVRNNSVSDGTILKLAQEIHPTTIQELVIVSEACHFSDGDIRPRIKEELMLSEDKFEVKDWLLKRSRLIGVENSKPTDIIRGQNWIDWGYKPSKSIGELIMLSNELRDEKNYTKAMIFQEVDGINNSEEAVQKLRNVLGQ